MEEVFDSNNIDDVDYWRQIENKKDTSAYSLAGVSKSVLARVLQRFTYNFLTVVDKNVDNREVDRIVKDVERGAVQIAQVHMAFLASSNEEKIKTPFLADSHLQGRSFTFVPQEHVVRLSSTSDKEEEDLHLLQGMIFDEKPRITPKLQYIMDAAPLVSVDKEKKAYAGSSITPPGPASKFTFGPASTQVVVDLANMRKNVGLGLSATATQGPALHSHLYTIMKIPDSAAFALLSGLHTLDPEWVKARATYQVVAYGQHKRKIRVKRPGPPRYDPKNNLTNLFHFGSLRNNIIGKKTLIKLLSENFMDGIPFSKVRRNYYNLVCDVTSFFRKMGKQYDAIKTIFIDTYDSQVAAMIYANLKDKEDKIVLFSGNSVNKKAIDAGTGISPGYHLHADFVIYPDHRLVTVAKTLEDTIANAVNSLGRNYLRNDKNSVIPYLEYVDMYFAHAAKKNVLLSYKTYKNLVLCSSTVVDGMKSVSDLAPEIMRLQSCYALYYWTRMSYFSAVAQDNTGHLLAEWYFPEFSFFSGKDEALAYHLPEHCLTNEVVLEFEASLRDEITEATSVPLRTVPPPRRAHETAEEEENVVQYGNIFDD